MTKAILIGCVAAVLSSTGCTKLGKVQQGRVIAYDKHTQKMSVILEPAILPPVVIAAPTDPNEMGPAPSAGGLIQADSNKRRVVIYDRATQSLRAIAYTPLEERPVANSRGLPVIDRAKKTITIYSSNDRRMIRFAASDDLLAMPADTWKAGDVVRYYYKDPAQALRMMNVTKTDLSKATG